MDGWKIVGHWDGGTNKASSTSRNHYQAIVEGDETVVYGKNTPEDQINTSDGVYGAHTRAFNTKCIGVAVAGMHGATEVPLQFGDYPINERQFDKFCRVIAEFCAEYNIPVSPTRVLLHSEVQPNLGIPQRQKWDINHLPWDNTIVGHVAVGNHMRALVSKYLIEAYPHLSHLATQGSIPAHRPTLRIGDRGADVRVLQADLHSLRYFSGKNDGHFGKLTRGAVLALQADAGIYIDGIVGPRTWAALKNVDSRPDRDITEADLEASGTLADTRKSDRLADLAGLGAVGKTVADVQGSIGEVQAAADGALGLWQTVQPYWPLAVIGVGYLVWRGMNASTRKRRVSDAVKGAHVGR